MQWYRQWIYKAPQIYFFALMPWAAQMAQTEEFLLQNEAYKELGVIAHFSQYFALILEM